MGKPTGFDNERYLSEQTQAILDRVSKFKGKLYLEFGGKLSYDWHAARVLPGYDPNVKIKLLQRLAGKVEIIFCVSAKDLAKGRMRGDYNITYDLSTLRALDDLRDYNLPVAAVTINRFSGESAALQLKNKVERRDIRVYTQGDIEDYPNNVDLIVSEQGYGKNPYIETSKPIVIITGAGPGSGKMATGLSQMYHDHKAGRESGFAKFETFPIWCLPVNHPINIAYEAATADLADFNLVDPFHLAAYNKTAVNYNRDVENFPILKSIIEGIVCSGCKTEAYQSPTDMGVNRAAKGIVDDNIVREAARQEIIRRWFRYRWEYRKGVESKETVDRSRALMQKVNAKPEDRKPVVPARKAAVDAEKTGKGNKGVFCGTAIELDSGEIMTGKNSSLMHSGSAAVLNAIKHLAGIPDNIPLLPPAVILNLTHLKRDILGMSTESLDVSEILVALSISANRRLSN